MQHKQVGFTLIELMIVVILIAIMAAIATPVYQGFVRKSDQAEAQQRIQRIASELELFKSRQFNYAGFVLDTSLQYYPNATAPKYTFTVYDGTQTNKKLNDAGVTGRSWVITAEASADHPKLLNYIMTSSDKRCQQPQGETLVLDCDGVAPWSK